MSPETRPVTGRSSGRWLGKHRVRGIFTILAACLLSHAASGVEPKCSAETIADTLLQDDVRLDGLRIVAQSTKVTHGDYDQIARVFESRPDVGKEELGKLIKQAGSAPKAVTNRQTHVYSARGDDVLVVTRNLDERDALIEERRLATPKRILISRSFRSSAGNTNATVLGEIAPRVGNDDVGWPRYLSKGTLGQWVKTAVGVECTVRIPFEGEVCYVISVPAPTNSPTSVYELFIRTNDMTPLQLNSYLPNGKRYSSTKLDFDGWSPQSFCRHALSRSFRGDEVSVERDWAITEVSKSVADLAESEPSFFPPGTIVSDKRFSRPITYTQGVREPNEAEIQAMLASPRAVVQYERETRSESQLAHMRSAARDASSLQSERVAKARVVIWSLLILSILFGVIGMYRVMRRIRS